MEPQEARDHSGTATGGSHAAAAARQVLPAIADMLAAESQLIVLVKPQFEAGKSQARSRRPCKVYVPTA